MSAAKASACLLTFLSVRVLGQPAPAVHAFEVSTVRRNPAGTANNRMEEANGTLNYNNVSLRILIRKAYVVQDMQIAGPGWLSDERYDISAKYPPGTDFWD